MDMFLEPEFFVPLIVNLALGFIVALCSRRIVWSLVSCSAIPLLVVIVRYADIFSGSGEAVQFGLMQAFMFVLVPGLAACWLGAFLGLFVRRLRAKHDDA
jgi:large-conductance mechanosensitive channel